MGCPICLDSFGEDTDRGTRPVALSCGHVFHKACSEGWLKACRTKGDPVSCPLCKKDLGSSHALPLWPSDVSDLDQYMQHRARRIELQRNRSECRPAPATLALDRYMSRDAQAALLGKLIDFRQHVNAYVMAVNNVSMSAYGGEDRIFRLFRDASKGSHGGDEEEFRRTLDALTGAVTTFEAEIGAVQRERRRTEKLLAETVENHEKTESMRKSYQQHMERKALEEQRMNEEAQRMKRLQLHLKRELQDVENKKVAMEKERQSYVREAREKSNEAMKARLETAQMIAQSRGDAELKVCELHKYVQEQERLRIVAEDRAREERKKSAMLADRNRLLSGKLDAARKELKELHAGVRAGLDASDAASATAAAKGKAKAIEASRDGAAKPDPCDNDDLAQVDMPLTPSISGEEHSQTSQPDWTGQGRYDVPPRKRSRDDLSSHVKEENDGVIIVEDDLDDEFDDSSYAMPSFSRNTSSGRASSAYMSASSGAGRSASYAAGALVLPGDHRPRNNEDADLDDSVEVVGVKRSKTTNGRASPRIRTPRRSSRNRPSTSDSASGLSSMLSDNPTLYSRIVSGSMLLGPRRRAAH